MGWNNKNSVMTSQGSDEGSKAGLLSDGSGIAVPLSCPQCSSEARVDLSWGEIHTLSQGQMIQAMPGMWFEKTVTGFVLGRVCDYCARHYAANGVPIEPRPGQSPVVQKQALLRRREVSASRPIGYEMLLKWLSLGKARGLC